MHLTRRLPVVEYGDRFTKRRTHVESEKRHEPPLRIVAWELTRRCNLSCVHCRAAAADEPVEGELTTAQVVSVMDDIARVARPLVILTGGEPMLREDLFEIIRAGRTRGFTIAVASNGTLLDETAARRMKRAGVHRVSISLDGAGARSHDAFRGVPGAFEAAMKGCRACRAVGLPFQINTTVTARNVDEVEPLLRLAAEVGAVAYDVFMLVPVGRGEDLADVELSAPAQERLLNWLYEQYRRAPIPVKATCAPHFQRILRQRGESEGIRVDTTSRGCLAGRSFVFIGNTGEVQPCGYLPIRCGNVLAEGFAEIWKTSEVFRKLRDDGALSGKCGRCEYVEVCGGCRARAYAGTGDYLGPEPFCSYQPGGA